MAKRSRRAYILILPSMLTTGSLFCGFYAIIRTFNGDFERAAFAILLASVFDLLDGRVARITGSTSHFGMEYDSIADVVSFGLAPALLSYVWALKPFGRLGWAGAFFFVASGALRLARFNTTSDETPKSYFIGLPTPAAAVFVASLVIAQQEVRFAHFQIFMLVCTFFLGLLMVSNVRYRSLKDFDIRHKRSFFYLVLLVLSVAFVAVNPEVTLSLIVGYYVIWGALREAMSWIKRRAFRRRGEAALIDQSNSPQGK